jgi:hypothetical protein
MDVSGTHSLRYFLFYEWNNILIIYLLKNHQQNTQRYSKKTSEL